MHLCGWNNDQASAGAKVPSGKHTHIGHARKKQTADEIELDFLLAGESFLFSAVPFSFLPSSIISPPSASFCLSVSLPLLCLPSLLCPPSRVIPSVFASVLTFTSTLCFHPSPLPLSPFLVRPFFFHPHLFYTSSIWKRQMAQKCWENNRIACGGKMGWFHITSFFKNIPTSLIVFDVTCL